MLFSVVTGMIVAAAMPIVGVLLVSALIVLPAALAVRLARSFAAALIIAMLVGVAGVFSGLTASYELGTPPGGTIALFLLVLLILGIVLKKVSVIARKLGNRQNRTIINNHQTGQLAKQDAFPRIKSSKLDASATHTHGGTENESYV